MSQTHQGKQIRVESLKDEGNRLFVAKKFEAAIKKYGEAIALDDQNPILFANRAACNLSLRRYMDAAIDAAKATHLNPNYPKAWARLATAYDELRQFEQSVICWSKALETLPQENLAESELKQKEQYEKGCAAARRAEKDWKKETQGRTYTTRVTPENSQLPWVRAMEFKVELERERKYDSSAWAIASAYEQFLAGTTEMDDVKTFPVAGGLSAVAFNLRSIANITNAILCDRRVLQFADGAWVAKVNKQIRGETAGTGAWTNAGPTTLMQEANARRVEKGWGHVRQAVSTTVRCWILLGHLQGGLNQNEVLQLEYLDRVLEVVRWGRREWNKVPTENRGVVFLESFMYGVQGLHMEALMKVSSREKNIEKKLQRLEELRKEADEVIDSVSGNPIPPRENDPSFAAAYYYYPRGSAYSMKGYYHREKAKLTTDEAEAKRLMREAAKEYMSACQNFYEGDEHHSWFMSIALENMVSGSAPPCDIAECMENLKAALPKMQKIWAKSAMAMQGRDARIQMQLTHEAAPRGQLP
ncbi:hypothetical protein AAF712_014538 [Marasmius tenuissimus]|uniref:Uncharacterized protein n=1 Tax=Marasmius tenuissimus TaxID=585030 RepID=A0ABR2ZB20_9AGAR